MNNDALNSLIIELWHTSRTALSGMPTVPKTYDRMQYIKRELMEDRNASVRGELTGKRLWFAIEDVLNINQPSERR